MEAAVPFALLSGVQLLCVVASLGLAVVGAAPAARRRFGGALVLGGLLLAASHVLTATLLGEAADDSVALLRAVGYVATAAGLAGWTTSSLTVLPVVAPVGAGAGAAGIATAAAVLAVGGSWRVEPAVRRWLVPAFALATAGEAVSGAAGERDTAAVVALCLRGAWALLVFVALSELARRSVRAKVVGAIVAAVVAIAVGASAVTGTVVTDGFSDDQRERISAVARGEAESLTDTAESNARFSVVLARCVASGLPDCDGLFEQLRREAVIFTPVFAADSSVVATGRLDSAAALALSGSEAVDEVLRTGGTVATLLVLPGSPSRVYAVGVTATRATPQSPVSGATAYASAVDEPRLVTDSSRAGYDITVLDPEGSVLGSSLAARVRGPVADLLGERKVVSSLAAGSDGVLVDADGSLPTVHYTALRDARGDLIAVLGLSAPSDQILRTLRNVLRVLFGTTLLIGLLAAALALLLARRITRPIEQLTVTASRIRRGDLAASADVTSTDEVGVLSRAFDAMTRSLSTSNDELRVAAAEQSNLRARLATIVDSMADGVLITDGAGIVTGLNPVGEELLGLVQTQAVGRPIDDVLVGQTPSGMSLLDGGSGESAGVLRRPDGSGVEVSVMRTSLRDADGSVVVLRDTTREAQVERMKTEFLSNVSHELRTPLTPIRGYAEILRRRPDLPATKTQQYAGSILEASLRMSRVVDLLVDVAAIEAGRVVPAPAAINVGGLVDRRLAAWQARAPEVTLRRRVAAGLPAVLVDEEWVGKAVDELVDNAAKYGGGGPITLSAGMEGRRVRLSVRDSGPGISATAQRALFSDFEQVDGSATRSVGGLGLGLSFVRRVAESFGLTVGFSSAAGKGATFWLDLPAAPASARAARSAPARPRRPVTRRTTATATSSRGHP
ncbi:MAG TPA: ATP-binding protein [Mycobacteriales bacterium]|nr:ATP-binding protein [Mycobacteriales bacterium]